MIGVDSRDIRRREIEASPYVTALLTNFSIKGSREVGSELEGEMRVRVLLF